MHYNALTHSLHDFFKHHLGSDAVEPAFTILQKESNEGALTIKPFTGLLPIIEGLRNQGSKIAVWTNRDLESAQLILTHSGLEKFIEICVSGTCVTERKPHPEGLLRIVNHFDCNPSDITMVGDHEHDVQAAKSVGSRAIRASWHSYWDVGKCHHSDFQFFSVNELKSIALMPSTLK